MSGTSRSSRVFELGLWCATLLLSTAVVYAQTAQTQSDVEGAAPALEKSPVALRVEAETPRAFETLPTPILPGFVDSQNGSSVEDLIGVATARNPALLAARQNIIISQGRIVQAGLRPNPSISVDATNDRGFGSEGEAGFGISYAHPVELGGKRSKRLEVARLELEREKAELAFREQQLRADIMAQFAEALAAVEGQRAVKQLLQLNERMHEVTGVRLRRGDVARLDVNLVRVEVNRLQVQVLQLDNRVHRAMFSLKALVGLNAADSLTLRGDLQAAPLEVTLEEAQALALQNRADIQAARIAEEAAEAGIRLANAQGVPDVTLFFGYRQDRSIFRTDAFSGAFGLTESDRPALIDSDKTLNYGVSIDLPFFNRNQGVVQSAVGTLAQARHTREFMEAVVQRDVAIALSRHRSARESVELFRMELLPRADENLQIIRAAYSLGDQPILQVIAEQRRFVESQNQYVDALKEHYLSLVELERAVGRSLR